MLRNCDDIFDAFAEVGIINCDGNDLEKIDDFGPIGFTPSVSHSVSLKTALLAPQNGYTGLQYKINFKPHYNLNLILAQFL